MSFDKTSFLQKLIFNHKDTITQAQLCLIKATLDILKQQARSFLHENETSYFNKLSHERRQLSFLLGHVAAKKAVLAYAPTLELKNILITYGDFNYPLIETPLNQHIEITYSHCNNLAAAIAFPESFPLGIDIETMATEKNIVIASQLTDDEKQMEQKIEMPSDVFHALLWTSKEALSKVLRTGLTTPFHIYEIKMIRRDHHYWYTEFKNFAQYQAISFKLGMFMCSIVFPLQSSITIDIPSLQRWYDNES